ncbi:MAG: DUF1957 domain-containing protein [Chitinispirillaceae bacterium]|nr:DUF1957 domain-containing protein [Chitinispirillaceae bacterium]
MKTRKYHPVSKTSPQGFLCLVLHAHLPFVRHPESPSMLEENWFFEALTETYLPLLSHLNALCDDQVPFRITISLSPTLCTMFTDELLQERYVHYISKRIELAQSEIDRNAGNPAVLPNARMYYERFCRCRWLFEEAYHRDGAGAFRTLQERGVIEIITSSATHAFLPAMQQSKGALKAQIRVATEYYRTLFGRDTPGMWLPECGYFPGLESLLHAEGIRYFFIDTHGLLSADPEPVCGVYAPMLCTTAPVAAFGRDPESSKSVWSAEEGYPGHPSYREFYRDIGFDLDIDYLRPYIDPAGIRLQTGIKYYRVTDKKVPDKKPYCRLDALRMAEEHAGSFMHNREAQATFLAQRMDCPPMITAPYDAELFGHWWYEGPEWLNFLIRKIAFEQNAISLAAPSDYLARFPLRQSGRPSFSSWGEGGFSGMWLHETNDWIYRHLSRMEERLAALAATHASAEGLARRALNQMARELLLAESSDWAFIMKSGTMVDYAVRRTREHIANFLRLHDDLINSAIDDRFLTQCETCNAIFPDIDFRVFADGKNR